MDWGAYVIGGFASIGATFFTNPIEVVKTRIQLQGELAARGTYVEPYKGTLHAFTAVVKNDGWSGLQKGLYNTAVTNGWILDKDGKVSFVRGSFFGALGGVIGCLASSPFYMIKTQLQSQAAKAIAVGVQHQHTGMFSAMSEIHRAQGVVGLWRGAMSHVPRATLGSGAQIATFGSTKSFLKDNDIIVQPTANSFAAGLIAGSIMSLAITPPDVVATRLYNQGIDQHGKGLFYSGVLDCSVKILRTEGVYGLYKGFWANYMRIAPHSTLVLLFFDEIMKFRGKFKTAEYL